MWHGSHCGRSAAGECRSPCDGSAADEYRPAYVRQVAVASGRGVAVGA